VKIAAGWREEGKWSSQGRTANHVQGFTVRVHAL